jgi:RNA polymerase sigma-70 factor (ECF subfamily)
LRPACETRESVRIGLPRSDAFENPTSNAITPNDPNPGSEPGLDVELLARARSGDKEALQVLCNHIEPRLRRAAQKRLGHLHEKVSVSDVLQSTFIDIVRGAESLPQESSENLERWSLRVLDNNIRDLARYFTAERRDRSKEQGLDAEAASRVPARRPSPATELIQTEDVTRLALAMAELTKDYQRILQLFMRPDFSHELAARTLGRSLGASRVLLARARAALLAKLEEQG